MNILISGASGLIGSALTKSLGSAGFRIFPLVRDLQSSAPFRWDPSIGEIIWDRKVAIDVVINLSGESIATGRWTPAKKQRILSSRIEATRLLANTLATLPQKPELFISGSAIGFYGDTGETIANEQTPQGTGFLADIAQQWEAAAQPARAAGIRTINLRTGMVLSTLGGALAEMLLPYRLGLGGKIGHGQQWMSWINIEEIANVVRFALAHESLSGPVNLVSPNPVRNAEFTRSLGHALHRPTLAPMPAWLARMIFGEMADHLLLSSTRVAPDALLAAGYRFRHPDLATSLQSLLSSNS